MQPDLITISVCSSLPVTKLPNILNKGTSTWIYVYFLRCLTKWGTNPVFITYHIQSSSPSERYDIAQEASQRISN